MRKEMRKEMRRKNRFLSFEKAREFARSLGLKSRREWLEYCKEGKRPYNIPAKPFIVYCGHWLGWRDWLGTKPPLFKRARLFARKLGLT